MRKRIALLPAALALSLAACVGSLSPAENSDAAIRARIEAALQAQGSLDLSHVDIDVHAQIVTVSGVVRTWEEKNTIERIVRRSRGVDQSLINLVVSE